FQYSPRYLAKDRSGKLPQFTDPDFGKILERVRTIKTGEGQLVADVPAEAKGSSIAQQGTILQLASDLGMDVEKDICVPAKLTWPLTSQQAEAVITRLKQRKAERGAHK